MIFIAGVLCTSALKPFLISPPMMGSALWGNVKNLDGPWYCPMNLENSWIWEGDQYAMQPLDNCMAEYLTCEFNETTGRPGSRKESEIYTVDFGGDAGLRYVNSGIFGTHFGPIAPLLEYLENMSYVFRETMFGAPFDWRLSPVVDDDYCKQLKEMVEAIYEKCGEKVTIMGYSGGCYAIQYFITETVTQEWKDKYVAKLLMCAPSYPGGLSAPELAWMKTGLFPHSDSESLRRFYSRLPTLYSHMPNKHVYADTPIIKGPKGESATAADLRKFLDEHDKLDDQSRLIWDYCEPRTASKQLVDPGVDVVFLINTALDTRVTLNFNESWDEFHYEYSKGDGVIGRDGLYWGCEHWDSGHSIHCYDYFVNNETYNHGRMMNHDEVREDIYRFVSESRTLTPGNFIHRRNDNGDWVGERASLKKT